MSVFAFDCGYPENLPLVLTGKPRAVQTKSFPLLGISLQDARCHASPLPLQLVWTVPPTGIDSTPNWYGLHPQLVWTPPRTGMDCTPNWYGLHPKLVWTPPRTGMDSTPNWYGLHPELGWTPPRTGMDCTPNWYGLHPQLGWTVPPTGMDFSQKGDGLFPKRVCPFSKKQTPFRPDGRNFLPFVQAFLELRNRFANHHR